MIRTVAIVGAGFAGLSTAKVRRIAARGNLVREAGRRRCRGRPALPLTTIAASPLPSDLGPVLADGAQVQRYLAIYADEFALTAGIGLVTEVLSATSGKGLSGGAITARTSGVQENEGIARQFDYLVVCNGIFSALSSLARTNLLRHVARSSSAGSCGECSTWAADSGRTPLSSGCRNTSGW